jgi:hypothetical protein
MSTDDCKVPGIAYVTSVFGRPFPARPSTMHTELEIPWEAGGGDVILMSPFKTIDSLDRVSQLAPVSFVVPKSGSLNMRRPCLANGSARFDPGPRGHGRVANAIVDRRHVGDRDRG